MEVSDMAGKKIEEGMTMDDLRRKACHLILGDKVVLEDEDGKETVATVVRFYPYLVQFEDEKGKRFTEDYLSASKARLIKPSGFESHNDAMDREEVLKELKGRSVGDDYGKEM